MSVKDKYNVKSIDSNQTYDWLLHKHYAKRIPSISYAFGLFDLNNILQGVLTIGKPASPFLCDGVCGLKNSQLVYELNRICVNDGLEKNTLSFFVSSCLKSIPEMILVSYADQGQNHHGYIYQASNFIYTGKTKERTDIGFEDGSHSRHYSKEIDTKKNRKIRTAKHRYIYFIGSKSQKKLWSKELNYKIEPYPKGKNKRYDSSYVPKVQLNMF